MLLNATGIQVVPQTFVCGNKRCPGFYRQSHGLQVILATLGNIPFIREGLGVGPELYLSGYEPGGGI